MAKKFQKQGTDVKARFGGAVSILGESMRKAASDDVLSNIIVLPELKEHIRRLKPEERELLKQDIQQNGCKDKILLWRRENDFPIIDGHNRFEICQELGIPFDYELRDFTSLEAVQEYMLFIQLGKRNLSAFEISLLK